MNIPRVCHLLGNTEGSREKTGAFFGTLDSRIGSAKFFNLSVIGPIATTQPGGTLCINHSLCSAHTVLPLSQMSASMESSSSSVSSASPESSVTSPPSSTPSIFEDDKVPFTAGANYLPSPFYPPTLAATDAISAQWLAPSLPAEYPPLPSHVQPVTRGDDKDKGTPDEWVLRDERLVRLTGKWPFNCEAPLPDLFNAVCLSSLIDCYF